MRFSLQAFLITALLFGIFVLLLLSIKLQRQATYMVEENIPFELSYQEEAIKTPKTNPKATKLLTHSGYNEAKEDLENIDASRNEDFKNYNQLLNKLDEAIENNTPKKAHTTTTQTEISVATSTPKNVKKSAQNTEATSIRYFLEKRQALFLDNPVYTCPVQGQVSVAIEVDASGSVVKASYIPNKSNTTNQCAVDQAIEYALKSKFTASSLANLQKGRITYLFQGNN